MPHEWKGDAKCPSCGFDRASEYEGDDGKRFIVCGICNHDTRTGTSPTPELFTTEPPLPGAFAVEPLRTPDEG